MLLTSLTTTGRVRRLARSLATRGRPGRTRREERGPRYMSIMVVDVSAYGMLDNRAQMRVRATLNAAVRDALRSAGIRWSLAMADRGDGMIVLVPANKSAVSLLDPVVPVLAARLRRHNETTGLRIRLRVSVHAGVVHRDATGWVGRDLNTACRLVDSPALRDYLGQRPADDMVVAVSDTLYHAVVQHRYRSIDPTAYEQVHVAVKELDTLAWVHVPRPEAPHSP